MSKAEDYYNEAWKAYQFEKYNEMVKALDKSIELKSNEAKFYFSKGIAYGELGKYEQAIENYDKAILLDEKYPNANSHSNREKVYYNRGNAYGELRNYEYEKAQKARSKHEYDKAIAYYDKAISLGDKEIKDYSKAVELNLNNKLLLKQLKLTVKVQELVIETREISIKLREFEKEKK